jgi:hypothetical protein
MLKKKKLSLFFKNKSKISIIEINDDNIQDKLDEINLNKIKKISKEAYTENIKNNMVEYVKTNNNINIKYDVWLKQFNKEDYIQEFEGKTRDNEIYHEIWDSLNKLYKGFEILY